MINHDRLASTLPIFVVICGRTKRPPFLVKGTPPVFRVPSRLMHPFWNARDREHLAALFSKDENSGSIHCTAACVFQLINYIIIVFWILIVIQESKSQSRGGNAMINISADHLNSLNCSLKDGDHISERWKFLNFRGKGCPKSPRSSKRRLRFSQILDSKPQLLSSSGISVWTWTRQRGELLFFGRHVSLCKW